MTTALDVMSWAAIVIAIITMAALVNHFVRQWVSPTNGYHRPREDRYGVNEPTRPGEGDVVYLDTILHNVTWFGVVADPDTPNMVTATLTMDLPPEGTLSTILEPTAPLTQPMLCCSGGPQWGHAWTCNNCPD